MNVSKRATKNADSTKSAPIGKEDILTALKAERQLVAKGVSYRVKAVDWDAAVLRIKLASIRGRRSGAIDDGLEETSCAWGAEDAEFEGRGFVSFVDSDEGVVVVDRWHGAQPIAGHEIRFFQQDFLQPLIDVWESPSGYRTARELLTRISEAPLDRILPLPDSFSLLRRKQSDAVNAALYPLALIDGPPGTGKTFTIGAMIANFLIRFPERRVLIIGPTNIAVDTSISAVDDWLSRLKRSNIARSMKRLGSRFDVRRYSERQHLLEPGLYEKAIAVLQAELEEPDKKAFEKYAVWKAKLRELRKALKTDVQRVTSGSRVIATTTASALHFYAEFADSSWDLVVADEASQIPFPSALVLGGLAPRCVFAGDPRQLAPVVQEKTAQRVLEKTAFDVLNRRAHSVFLNEQSRMCQPICEAVSAVFYDSKLKLCTRTRADRDWKKTREPYYIQGQRLPHLVLKKLDADSTWSTTYNGPIRFGSAKFIAELIDEILGSYANEGDVVVLTPYRAQRALISEFFRNRNVRVDVSTVHRAQGSERRIVIFDTVSANERFLNSESGFRLLNVAFSRAQTHLIIPVTDTDFYNPKIRNLAEIANRQQSRLTRFDLPSIIQ